MCRKKRCKNPNHECLGEKILSILLPCLYLRPTITCGPLCMKFFAKTIIRALIDNISQISPPPFLCNNALQVLFIKKALEKRSFCSPPSISPLSICYNREIFSSFTRTTLQFPVAYFLPNISVTKNAPSLKFFFVCQQPANVLYRSVVLVDSTT